MNFELMEFRELLQFSPLMLESSLAMSSCPNQFIHHHLNFFPSYTSGRKRKARHNFRMAIVNSPMPFWHSWTLERSMSIVTESMNTFCPPLPIAKLCECAYMHVSMEKAHNFYQILSKGFVNLKWIKNDFLMICAPNSHISDCELQD